MPISDQELQDVKNRFVAVTCDATIGQAIAAWQDLKGEPWWHLVVRMHDGSFRVARFSAVYQALQRTDTAADIKVHDLAQLTAVPVADQEAIDTSEAQAIARRNPARVLVVTSSGLPVGILVEGVRRGAGLLVSAVNIGELGGKYVKLKDYGSILLGSSRKTSETK